MKNSNEKAKTIYYKILTDQSANPKMSKAGDLYRTAILHLAPEKLSGITNTCPFASDGCKEACLNRAGRGGMGTDNVVQRARVRRTKLFVENKKAFFDMLIWDIKKLVRIAKNEGKKVALRLNGTSDLPWENIKINGKNLMALFPDIIFYDYSKNPKIRTLPINYHITFSRSETNHSDVVQVLKRGGNVAIVFGIKKGQPLPPSYMGFTVIDADKNDHRFLDGKNVISGIRAKGPAKKDHSGFVVFPQSNSALDIAV